MIVPFFSSCSQPPEYSEIEPRFKELIEAAKEINIIFFGEGLPTYERVYDPRSTTKVYTEKYVDENGKEAERRYYYSEIEDDTYGRVIAYRTGYSTPYVFVQILTYPEMSKTPVFVDEWNGLYAYALPDYKEPEHEFFYTAVDPTDYDYVRYDCEFTEISQIKAKAAEVYSSEYLESISSSMFVGTVASGSVGALKPRYMEYADDEGNVYLMESNEFETFITENREFDFSTARMVKPSNAKYVSIEIESYMPSKPNVRTTIKVSLLLENGKWMLDSATY